ncbi:MAG: LytR/AlgR family response regulator transcription factor [Bacteroidota bacterium]
MKVLIVDDEKPARDLLNVYLSAMKDVEIAGEAANGFEAMKAIADIQPDLVFLDIQMPKLTGFEMLELLDNPPAVIFTTAYDEYALKAFEINAVDYLMKPFDKERLEEAVEKFRERKMTSDALNRLKSYHDDQKDQLDRLVVKKGRAVRILQVSEVIFLTAEDDYVMIHTEKDRYLKSKTMKYFEQHLPPHFIRIHRSYIINLHAIETIEPYKKDVLSVKMSNGKCLHTSKSGATRLRNMLK